jgi:hypothetical protein
MEVWDQRDSQAALPPGMPWTDAEKLAPAPPPGFDPWTHQPAASRYTDWTIPAPPNFNPYPANMDNMVSS